ncbi:MAG: hypothetical protein GKS06_13595 [Acidobacteria bacterium]|nr:hypothetical protein [Acidobacteriota bacterium]
MRKPPAFIPPLMLAFAAIAALAMPGIAGAQVLSDSAQEVVEYLLQDWERQFSSTSIPHAIEYMGLAADDELRIEVVEHLRANDDLARNLQWWGANNYLFSNLEKRLAKYLIYMHDREVSTPSAGEVATVFGLSVDELRRRLDFMVAGGFLQSADSPLGYELAPGFRRWAGPLQHNFHTVRIEGEAPLDVW